MSEQFGLSSDVILQIKKILHTHPLIQKTILYGSRAMGTYKNGSDIDLTLIAPQMNLSELLQIENEIDDQLLPYKVDLSLFHKIENVALVEHIQRVGKEF